MGKSRLKRILEKFGNALNPSNPALHNLEEKIIKDKFEQKIKDEYDVKTLENIKQLAELDKIAKKLYANPKAFSLSQRRAIYDSYINIFQEMQILVPNTKHNKRKDKVYKLLDNYKKKYL